MEFATLPVRMMATVVGAFGVVALLLAAVGLYGVLAFWVNQGVRDLAIRVALGARPSDVVGQVVKRGVWMAGIGLAIGLLASFGIGVVVSGLVFGVSATDPVAYAVGVVVLPLSSWCVATKDCGRPFPPCKATPCRLLARCSRSSLRW